MFIWISSQEQFISKDVQISFDATDRTTDVQYDTDIIRNQGATRMFCIHSSAQAKTNRLEGRSSSAQAKTNRLEGRRRRWYVHIYRRAKIWQSSPVQLIHSVSGWTPLSCIQDPLMLSCKNRAYNNSNWFYIV